MKTWFSCVLLTLMGLAAAWAQPVLDADWTSGSDWADEQTSGPVVADINGDGLREVILTGRNDVWVFNAQHPNMDNPLFHWQMDDGYEMCSPAAVAHLTSDGKAWIVVGASVAVHYEAGSCPFRHREDCATYGTPPVEDPNCHYDGDCYHWRSIIRAWKITGTGQRDYEVHFSSVCENQRLTTPAVADVDNDQKDELCFVGSDSYGLKDTGQFIHMRSTVGVHFYEYDNGFNELLTDGRADEVPWGLNGYTGWSESFRQIAQTVPAAGDVNGDGKPEFITQCLWIIKAWSFADDGQPGTAIWVDSLVNDAGGKCMPDNCLVNEGTINGASKPWHYGNYEENGQEKPGWDGMRSPGPVLADLDNDGQLEAYFLTSDGGGYIWQRSGQTGERLHRYLWMTYGQDLHEGSTGSELGICDDDGTGQPKLFGNYDMWNSAQGTHQLGTWRWDADLAQLPGIGNPAPFPYQRPDDAYPPTHMYTLAMLPCAWGNGFTVDVTARDSLIFERTITHESQTSLTGAVDNGPVQSNITGTDLDNDGLLDYVYTDRLDGTTSHVNSVSTTIPYNPENIEWSGYRNNPQHTGLYAQPVSGNQVPLAAKWKGRIIVTDLYNIPAGHTLDIEPGTVIELNGNAQIQVHGALNAAGTDQDSIYFKPNGSSPWDHLSLFSDADVTLDHCVIHGGKYVQNMNAEATIRHSHIYDMRADSIAKTTLPENALR